MNKRYMIATSKVWNDKLIEKLSKSIGAEFVLVGEREELSYKTLSELGPRYVFFPHWSYVIPPEIYQNFECIIFHMTDVPFGRGGSPLQNLIDRGIYQTKVSALRAVKELDAGDVYLKRELPLCGTAEEIYIRTTKIIVEMIKTIIETTPTPVPQSGEVVQFKRRTPEQSNIANLDSRDRIYDYIRMLDAEGYPHAYLETKHFRFEFTRATLRKGSILADVRIFKK